MAKTPKYTKSDVLRAIRGDPDKDAPEKGRGENGWVNDLWVDNPQESSWGHIPTIAARLGCSDQTVRNYASRTNREGKPTSAAAAITAAITLEKQRGLAQRADFHHQLVGDAELGLHANVKLLDVPSIRFALERLDKEHYAARTEMTGAGGVALYDDDAQRALAELAEELDAMGQDPSETVVNAVNGLRAKLAEIKNKGKDKPDSTGSQNE